MIVSTTEKIAGRNIIQTLGIVIGNTTKARSMKFDFIAGLKTLFGGEVQGQTKLMYDVRGSALERKVEEAKLLDADAVVCVRFVMSDVMTGVMELCVYGTAVKLE